VAIERAPNAETYTGKLISFHPRSGLLYIPMDPILQAPAQYHRKPQIVTRMLNTIVDERISLE
jgi:hypothetical protein